MSEQSAETPITHAHFDKVISEISDLIPEESKAVLVWAQRMAMVQTALANSLTEEVRKLKKEYADLQAALDMYERESGESQILFRQNLDICLDQVRMGKR